MLPRPPDTFLGRDAELQRLLSHYPGRRIVLLKGMAGIGKTALALRFLQQLRLGRPDLGVTCVRCFEGSTLDDVMAEVAAGRESPEADTRPMPPRLQDRVLAFLHVLNTGGGLLFLDDIHLLPEPELALFVRLLQEYLDAHVLMTSRRELPLPAVETVDVYQERLGGLTASDAALLIGSLIALHGNAPELVPEALERVCREAAGHPFLLRLLASLVVTRSLDATAFTGGAVESRRWLIERVLGEVEAGERAALEVMAAARAALPSEVLAAVTGDLHAARTLSALEGKFLVEREVGGSARIHQVLADHVLAEMEPERRRQVHGALADHLQDQPQHAFHHAMEARLTERAAAILSAAAGRLCSRGLCLPFLEDVRRLEAAGAHIPAPVRLMQANALSVTGRGPEGLSLLRALSLEAEEPSFVADALTSMGGAHLNTGHYLSALACYQEALPLCGERPGPALFKCLNYMALIRGYRGEMRVARDLLRRSLSLAQGGQEAARLHALRIQATLLSLEDRFDEALAVGNRALEQALASGLARLAAFARYAVALARIGRGENAAAREMLTAMCLDGERMGDIHVQAYAHLGLGQVAWEEGALDEAARSLQAAARSFDAQGDGLGAAMADVRLGMVRLEQERIDESPNLCEHAAQAAREGGNPRLEAEALLALSEHGLLRGDLQVALDRAKAAAAVLADLDLPLLSCEALLLQAEAHAHRLRWNDVDDCLSRLRLPPDEGWSLGLRARALRSLRGGRRKPAEDRTPRGVQGRRLERFYERLSKRGGRRYRVVTEGGAHLATEDEAASLRRDAERYAFFLDASERVLRVEGKGVLPVFRRRVISRLLIALLNAGERGRSAEELVPEVWGVPYDGENSALEVRKAVSRLRDLIEADRAHPLLVRHYEGVAGAAGRYGIRLPVSACAILEVEE